MSVKDIVWSALKAGLFVLLIYLLVKTIPVAEIHAALKLFTLPTLISLILLLILRYLLLALRWKYACGVHGVNLPARWFVRSEFEILFLEFTLPLPNAEDVFRIIFLKSKKVSVTTGISVALLLRVSGLSVILILLLGLIVQWGNILPHSISGNVPLIALLTVLALVSILFHKSLLKKTASFLIKLPGVGSRLAGMIKYIVEMPIRPEQYFATMAYSILIFLCIALYLYLLVADTSYTLDFITLLLLVPLFMLSFLLPLSIQGLGLPEATLALVLPIFGVSQTMAVAVATIHFAAFVLLILSGGILVWLSSGNKWKEIKVQLNEWKVKR